MSLLYQHLARRILGAEAEPEGGFTDAQTHSIHIHEDRIYPHATMRRRLFTASAIERVKQTTGRLDDKCVADCAHLLMLHFEVSTVGGSHTVFSPYIVCSDSPPLSRDAMWRNTRASEWWKSDIWIIPIYREVMKHWVLAVVYLKEHRIAYFDSFGNVSCWKNDALVSSEDSSSDVVY